MHSLIAKVQLIDRSNGSGFNQMLLWGSSSGSREHRQAQGMYSM